MSKKQIDVYRTGMYLRLSVSGKYKASSIKPLFFVECNHYKIRGGNLWIQMLWN